MPFTLPPLPFERDSLIPHMSPETLDLHHGRHHRAYVDHANTLAAAAGLRRHSLLGVIRAAPPGALRDNAAQIWNHTFFWQCMAPDSRAPTGQLAMLIEQGFGSHGKFVAAFTAAASAHFGSGWVWLVLEGSTLRITALHDGDTPALHEGMAPLLTLDLCEHAYDVDHCDARRAYIAVVMDHLVNWTFVAMNLDRQGLSRGDQG